VPHRPTRATFALALASLCAALSYAPSARAEPLPVPAPAPSEKNTRVRIVSPNPASTLERRIGSLATGPAVPESQYASAIPRWEQVCVVTCPEAIPIGGEYRIAGQGVTPSSSFALRAPSVELHVKPGSHTARRIGTAMAMVGVLAAAAGGVSLLIALSASDSTTTTNNQPIIIGSAATAIGGSVIGLVGLGIVLASGTTVRDEQGRELPAYQGSVSSVLFHATGYF